MVLQLYHEAVQKYGHPFHVRMDHGGENVDVWHDMIQTWGEEARPVIVGSLVHNQPIKWHNQAAQLESEGLLDHLNETDLFCLHWILR